EGSPTASSTYYHQLLCNQVERIFAQFDDCQIQAKGLTAHSSISREKVKVDAYFALPTDIFPLGISNHSRALCQSTKRSHDSVGSWLRSY
ncbi:hypothetical protein BpHYR1_048233, partial [Brachionus plicatilis]